MRWGDLLGSRGFILRCAVVVIAQRDDVAASFNSLDEERDGEVTTVEGREEWRSVKLFAEVVEKPVEGERSAFRLGKERYWLMVSASQHRRSFRLRLQTTYLIQLPGAMMPTNSVSGERI